MVATPRSDSARGSETGRSTGYLIGERSFRTKGEAGDHIRSVRDKYGVGATVADVDDQEFLTDLLQLHPQAAEKIGSGVDHFDVRANGSTVGFWIVRTDGTETDFSFVKCLRPPSHAEEVRTAMRKAVQGQKHAARDAAFTKGEVRCPYTDEALTPDTSHVHHEGREFVVLADAFANEHGGYDRIVVVAGDGELGRRLQDDGLEREWQAFHEKYAVLVVVSRRANLSDLRRGRRRPR